MTRLSRIETPTVEFFHTLWPEIPDHGAVCVHTPGDGIFHWYRTARGAASCAAILDQRETVLTMPALIEAGCHDRELPHVSQVLALCGLVVDVPLDSYEPKTDADWPRPIQIIEAPGMPTPTFVLENTRQLQAWWVFGQPWFLLSDRAQRDASALWMEWQEIYQKRARAEGFSLALHMHPTCLLSPPSSQPDGMRITRRAAYRLSPDQYMALTAEVLAA